MPRQFRLDRMRRIRNLAPALIVACGLLVACSSGNEDPPATSQGSNPTESGEAVATALSGTPRLGEAIWTSAVAPETNAPLALAPKLTDSTIYAVFPIESLPAGSHLLASWYFNDTSLDALDSAMRVDQDRSSGWIEFHIERTGSEQWPDGEYSIVVSDGTIELQRAVLTIP